MLTQNHGTIIYACLIKIAIYPHCSLPHTIPLTEGILRLGLSNFQSKVESGKAGGGSVAAEEIWLGSQHAFSTLFFRFVDPKHVLRGSFILFDKHVVYVDY